MPSSIFFVSKSVLAKKYPKSLLKDKGQRVSYLRVFWLQQIDVFKCVDLLSEMFVWYYFPLKLVHDCPMIGLTNLSVILLQIVMVSPGTHLVKNHESLSGTNESQLIKRVQNWKYLVLYVTQTDSKTLYYSILKLKYSPSILKYIKG